MPIEPTAVAAVGHCGACGGAVSGDEPTCPRCRRVIQRPRPVATGTLLAHGVVDAGAFPRATRIALDLAVAAWLVAVGVLVTPVLPGLWLALAVIAAGWLVWSSRTGRSPAAVILGQRVVGRVDDEAPGVLRALLPFGTTTADLRHGRDPFAAPPPPPEWTAAYAAIPSDIRPDPGRAPRRSSRVTGSAPVTLALDSGQQVTLIGSAVVGRNPADLEPGVRAVAWPDLSRTLSKNHARLDWDGLTLWVTDLGSTNGSGFTTGGPREVLAPFRRTAVPVGAAVSLGDRTLTVLTAVGERG